MLQLLKRMVGMPVTAADFVKRGDWHADAGDQVGALRDYRRARELAPHDPAVLCKLADALAAADQLEDAIKMCDEAIGRDASCAQAYYVRGVARRNSGAAHDALADLRQAVRLAPDHANARAVLKTLEDIVASQRSS